MRFQPISPPVSAWSRLSNESGKAFEAFCLYKNQGLYRSHVKVAAELGKSVTLMDRWATKYNWWERVMAYDAFLEQVREEARRQAVAKAAYDAQLEELRLFGRRAHG
jgi:hypothetical protein